MAAKRPPLDDFGSTDYKYHIPQEKIGNPAEWSSHGGRG